MEKITQLFSVLWAPRKTLWEISQSPRVIAPLVLLMLFAVLDTTIVFSKLDPGELRLKEFERGGYADKISDSDKAIHAQRARDQRTFAATVTAVRPLIVVLIVAGIFYLCLGLGRRVPFKPFLAVTAFAFIPGILHSLFIVGTVLAAEPTTENLQRAGAVSPILFLDSTSVSRATYEILGMVDVVSIWILALLIIGYGFVLRDRVSPVLRVLVVVGVYCLWSALYVGARLSI